MPCSFEHEFALARTGISPVAGIDEAGRGPLAGPVVAAAVILPVGFMASGIDDSKKLTPGRRMALYELLTTTPEVIWASALRSSADIDRMNILRATHEAMREAALSLQIRPAHVLIDGLPVPAFPFEQSALVGGDGISLSIAAASIIAKVERDRIMEDLDRQYPHYNFRKNKGYPTPAHLEKLRLHGPCPAHRKSYAPVAQATLF